MPKLFDYAAYAAKKQQREKEAARKAAQRHRDAALAGMTHTFADGRVVQVRPQDEPNFSRQIEKGEGRQWILADNTTAHLTLEELQEAVAAGIAQGEAIWDEYMAVLEVLNVD